MPEKDEKHSNIIQIREGFSHAIVVADDDARRARLLAASPAVLHAYLDSRTAAKSRATMAEGLQRIARARGTTTEAFPWAALTPRDTGAIRAYLIRERRPATVKVTLVALRGVLREAWRQGLITQEELARLTDWPKVTARRLPAGRSLEEAEIDAIGALLEREPGARGIGLRCVFAVLVGAGLRANEFCELDISAYSGGMLRFIRKGNKEAIIPVGDIAPVLDEWIETRKGLVKTRALDQRSPQFAIHIGRNDEVRGAWTVKRLEHLCSELAGRASVSHFSPHDCRRTFATRMLDAGVDLATVQRLMGHESPETTAKYDRRQAKEDAVARDRVRLMWGR